MLCYVLFFMLPIILIIFSDSALLNQYCYVIAYFAQLGFFGYEIIQLRAQGMTYLQGYNISDVF
jgi:hypothetical protein